MANTIKIGLAEEKTLSDEQAVALLLLLSDHFDLDEDDLPEGLIVLDNDGDHDAVRRFVDDLKDEGLNDLIEVKALTYVNRGQIFSGDGDTSALLAIKKAGGDLTTYEFPVGWVNDPPTHLMVLVDVNAEDVEEALNDTIPLVWEAKAALAWEPTGFPAK